VRLLNNRDSGLRLDKNGYVAGMIKEVAKIYVYYVSAIYDRPERFEDEFNNNPVCRALMGYHNPDNPDIMIQSLDGADIFPLTVDNLRTRPKTRNYLLGDGFMPLVSKNPAQIPYIIGVLNPRKKEEILSHKDGDLMFMKHSNTIEPWETNIRQELNTMAQNFRSKHDLNAFVVTDKYFRHAYLGVLVSHLVAHFLNIRLKNIHTARVCDFLLKQELLSYGLFTRDILFLSRAQRYFLYKNIQHITKNVGKSHILRRTIEGLVRYSSFSVSGYQPQLVIDEDEEVDTLMKSLPYYGKAVNLDVDKYESAKTDEEAVVTKEVLQEELLYSPVGNVGLTKSILVNPEHLIPGSVLNFNDFALYNLIYVVNIKSYTGNLNVAVTELRNINVSVSRALELLMLGLAKRLGVSQLVPCEITLPIVYNGESVNREYIETVRTNLTLAGDQDFANVISSMLIEHIPIPVIKTAQDFLDYVVDRYTVLTDLNLQAQATEDPWTREILLDVLYKLYPPATSVRLEGMGSSLEQITGAEELTEESYDRIYTDLTGLELDEQTGPWGNAIKNILNTLSSYATNFLVNDADAIVDVDMRYPEILSVELEDL